VKLSPADQVLDINAAGDRSTRLSVGQWRISGNREMWIRVGDSAVAAVAGGAGSSYLGSGEVGFITVTGSAADSYVAVIKGEDPDDGKASVSKE